MSRVIQRRIRPASNFAVKIINDLEYRVPVVTTLARSAGVAVELKRPTTSVRRHNKRVKLFVDNMTQGLAGSVEEILVRHQVGSKEEVDRIRDEIVETVRTAALATVMPQGPRDLVDQITIKWSPATRLKDENPAAFIERVYGCYIGRGLTQAHIRRHDRSLYTALHNWLRRPENRLWYDLPSRAEMTVRVAKGFGLDVETAMAGEGDAHTLELLRVTHLLRDKRSRRPAP